MKPELSHTRANRGRGHTLSTHRRNDIDPLSNEQARPANQYSVNSTVGPWEERGKETLPDDRPFVQRPSTALLLSTITKLQSAYWRLQPDFWVCH